eukprot:gene23943-32342_t
MNLLFSERFTNAIKECNSLGGFSTIPLPKDFSENQGVIAKKQTLSFSAAAYNSSTLKYLRKVELNGGGFNVFNFVIFPDLDVVDLPIFGVDIISLPGNSIISIDFQPLCSSDSYFSGPLYSSHSRLTKWSNLLPSQPIPPALSQFFSPLAIFAQFPPIRNDELFPLAAEAVKDYLDCYLGLAESMKSIGSLNLQQQTLRREFLRSYIEYRIVNDPAKKLLTAAFGHEWTDTALSRVMFPLDLCT